MLVYSSELVRTTVAQDYEGIMHAEKITVKAKKILNTFIKIEKHDRSFSENAFIEKGLNFQGLNSNYTFKLEQNTSKI
ncbi:MAG: hypothetical protein QXV01_09980 [Candidatus Bathyarchaeia archaeon]